MTSWWREGALYQIYPRSFRDASGDGVGDLRGILAGLDHVASLGVDAIWISPFFKSPMKDFGYDVVDHRAVDLSFGTEADFDALVEGAHARGLKVLIDLVLSHVSDQHPWFVEAKRGRGSIYDERFVFADPKPDGSPPNNWRSVFGGPAWSWAPERGQYYLHNFLAAQPDLNFHHPAVRAEALDIARAWLERGVDGFRLDTVNFYFHDAQLRDNPPAAVHDATSTPASNPYGMQDHIHDKNQPEVATFLEELGALCGQYGAMTVGEVGASPARSLHLMGEYTRPGRLSLCYSFDLLTAPLDADRLRAIFTRVEREAPDAWPCWAFSNHDVTRAATRLSAPVSDGGAPLDAAARLGLAILFTLRGTPCLYQGEELGLPEAEVPFERLVDPYGIEFWPAFKGRDGCRTPFPWTHEGEGAGFSTSAHTWLPVDERHRALALDHQAADPASVLAWTRELLALRRAHRALRAGNQELLTDEGPVLAWDRVLDDERVRCAFNLSGAPQRLNLDDPLELGPWEIRIHPVEG